MADTADMVVGIIVDRDSVTRLGNTDSYKIVGLKGLNLLNLELVDLPMYKDNFFSAVNNPTNFDLAYADSVGINTRTGKVCKYALKNVTLNTGILGRCLPIYDLSGDIVNHGDSLLGFLHCSPRIRCCIDMKRLVLVDMYVSKDIGNKPTNDFEYFAITDTVEGTTIDGLFSKIYTNSYEYGELLYFRESDLENFIVPKEYSAFYTDNRYKVNIKTLVLHSWVDYIDFSKSLLHSLENLYISKDSSKKLISSILFCYLEELKLDSINYDILCNNINLYLNTGNTDMIYDICRREQYRSIVDRALGKLKIIVY